MRDVARSNYEAASQSLREICDLTHHTLRDVTPRGSYPQYFDRPLELTRARQLELLRRNPPDLGVLEPLATVDLMLADIYRGQSRQIVEATRLLHESIDLWEDCIARGTEPVRARMEQLQALSALAVTGYITPSEAELHRREVTAERVYRELCGKPEAIGSLFELSYRERQVADYLVHAGQAERARRLLCARLGLFDSLRARGDSPDVQLARTLTLVALGDPGESGIPTPLLPGGETEPLGPIGTTPLPLPGGDERPSNARRMMLVHAVAELTARRFGLRTLGPDSGRDRAIAADPAWASRVVRSIDDQAERAGLEPQAWIDVAWSMREALNSSASYLRHVGKHGEARRISDRFIALASEYTRTRPDQVVSHLLACEAILQDAKNRMRTGDRATVRRLLENSLAAAMQARAVAPDSEEAARFVDDRRRRIAAHEAGMRPNSPVAAAAQ